MDQANDHGAREQESLDPVMHVSPQLIRRRGQDRAGFHRLPIPSPPAIPQASERKDSAVPDLEAEGLLPFDPALAE
jgi:hypothetical protein